LKGKVALVTGGSRAGGVRHRAAEAGADLADRTIGRPLEKVATI
jgi:hypothetical protein